MSYLPNLILTTQLRGPTKPTKTHAISPHAPNHHTPTPQIQNDQPPLSNRALLALAVEDIPTWLAGPYAILLQLASPAIALGSHTHSRFTSDPISRFLRTAVFVLAVTHGTPEQLSAITGVITKQHAHVRGKTYDARNAELQKWTAATLFVAQRKGRMVFGRGTRAVGREMEGLCLESGRFASVLDMPGEMWPEGLDQFEEYFAGEMGRIEREGVDGVSAEVGRVLLFGLGLPWWLGWVMVVVRVVVARWLPDGLRRAYGLRDPNGWGMWLGYWAVVWVVWGVDRAMPGFVKKGAAEDVQRTGRWMI
ncbi:hypothetical protein QBC34DRAFT_484557 [Podospora aff. communis PSN243]|uniref:ER-bound oxygenase mpaB/mpaB'/Rubber oxygenase catalytic domain-containing protein n=1 Tax=Podospora aff. communis PSN243 TaxID=3040156 RepID=A0AAV9GQY0_9PEZI|nr:hypothetical protein QBC34DRAFT_484557 [Podospora aff. communis PSN243]